MRKIEIFDTTLRDGQQARGISFNVEDKIKIAHVLDELKVDYLEGGWLGASPKVDEFFERMRRETLTHAKLVAFGSTHRFGVKAADDPFYAAILAEEISVACIFGKTWDLHVTDALNVSLQDNLTTIRDSIAFLVEAGIEVLFDAEHFFDGYNANPEFAVDCLQAAEDGGASKLVLCDTNGGAMPDDVGEIIDKITPRLKTPLGIHAHNDTDMAVANTLAAVIHGAVHVQGTINGYGERCGNANLCSVIPNLQIKLGMNCIPKEQMQSLTRVAHHVAEIANMTPNDSQPFVGQNAFAHKGGVHVSAVMKNPETYEHVKPELIGNKQEVTVSDQSGTSNLLYKAAEFGITVDKKDPRVKKLTTRIKEMENVGYAFEEGEASFELLLRRTLGLATHSFTLEGFRVIDDKPGHDAEITVEATIKINVDGSIFHTVAEGNGPVSALNGALRKALASKFPVIDTVRLVDYKVRVMNSVAGADAMVRVLIESTDGITSWGTVGVSTNVVEASWKALVDSLEFKLLESNK